MQSESPHHVLFVCMGNICRSPTGEGLFRHLVIDQGLEDHFVIDSAGTIGYHAGSPPDRRMRSAASRRGYALEGAARQIRSDDFEDFDLILAMDSENHRDISTARSRAGADGSRAELRMLSDFLQPTDAGGPWPEDVPDPYYGGDAGFEKVLDMIEAACPRILEYLVDGTAPPKG